MAIHAVLTGDIVNSTKLSPATEKKLFKILQQILKPYKFEFYRGDSFQVYMKEAAKSLLVTLQCRTAAISIIQDESLPASDIKIGIGLGAVQAPVKTLGSAKGEAFILSGRSFDELAKSETRLAISINDKVGQLALQVIADYVELIYQGMTAKQAEVIFELLKGNSQQEVALKLNKSKSTIHQHVTSGRWAKIENLLQQYEKLILQL
jgi:hypothetical protein